MRTPNVELRSTDTLDISSEDAMRLELSDGERVRVRSRYGEVFAPIRINAAVKPGELFATFHTSEVFLNRLIGSGRDNVVHTPEYKVVAVRIEKLSFGRCTRPHECGTPSRRHSGRTARFHSYRNVPISTSTERAEEEAEEGEEPLYLHDLNFFVLEMIIDGFDEAIG